MDVTPAVPAIGRASGIYLAESPCWIPNLGRVNARARLMQTVQYWAHSASLSQPRGEGTEGWQLLARHLEAVADLAGHLAELARPGDGGFVALARLAGLLHDYGKYSDCFQRMLKTGRGHCQHAIHGAFLACSDAGSLRLELLPLAAAIAGHHAGLPDTRGNGRALLERLHNEHRLHREANELRGRAAEDSRLLRDVVAAPQMPPAIAGGATMDLLTRMLFSCLVDADRLDSAGRALIQAPLEAAQRLEILLRHIGELASNSAPGPVADARGRVLEDCVLAASSPASLFSLSVPTGGGKTLAAMAFALRRAALAPQRFRRVIVVIPYLSIIEQNAQVYAKVFGPEAVLEHHSGSFGKLLVVPQGDGSGRYVPAEEPGDEDDSEQRGRRPETENWDAPIIVTTSVRFFESLFSNRPRDLRRVHNIARSIVILDEVQTLPRRLLAPLLHMVEELSRGWGVNFVFATATQPAFERPAGKSDSRWPAGTLTEIVREPEALRTRLRRTEIHWQIDIPMTWEQVAARALEAPQCLTVVNLRRHAAELYGTIRRMAAERGGNAESVFHLSTRMSAAHRLRQLDHIRRRLREGAPCQVISTQLIEAGVDVDFPLVLRAMAPLDAIVQAAGRADREGKLTAALGQPAGQVVVFLPVDHRMPPHEYSEAAGVTATLAKRALEEGADIQVDSAAAMRAYFERYYGTPGADLGAELDQMRAERLPKFATLAAEFEMISDRRRDVFVPDDEEARKALEDLRVRGALDAGLRRRLERHTVGLSPWEFQQARGAIYPLAEGSELWIAADHAYDEQLGLLFDVRPDQLVL